MSIEHFGALVSHSAEKLFLIQLFEKPRWKLTGKAKHKSRVAF